MKTKQQYKKFSKQLAPLVCVPQTKILKFHRPKWKKIQKKILKQKLQKTNFKNYGKIFCSKKRWEKISLVFKNQLFLKKTIQTLFFNSVTNHYLENFFFNNKVKGLSLPASLYIPEYRIDLLLFRLGFFDSPFLAKRGLQTCKIFLNNTIKVHFLITLTKGDSIYISGLKKIFFKHKLSDSILFFSFIEVDFYTNKIVIVKCLSELNSKDFLLLTRDLYNLLDVKDYLLK